MALLASGMVKEVMISETVFLDGQLVREHPSGYLEMLHLSRVSRRL